MRAYAAEQFAYFAARRDYPALIDRYLEESTDALRDWLARRDMSASSRSGKLAE